MKTKLIKIKDLKEGDLIKTKDINGNIVFKKVKNIRKVNVNPNERFILYFSNGTYLKCSSNHPIMVKYGDQIIQKYPQMLTEEDLVITENGFTNLIKISVDKITKNYIDIEVEEENTFLCSSYENEEKILTHNSQGGVRGGSGTLYYVIWHHEIEDMLVLKNNKGTESNRIRHLDYGVMISKMFYERLIQNKNITLFSPHEHPEMYEAFFNDEKKFKKLYEQAEKNSNVRKKVIKAKDLFSLLMQERKDTGRIYILNVDHANNHSSFLQDIAPVRMSNLCLEITLPTKPLKKPDSCGYKKVFVKVKKEKMNEYKEWRSKFKNLIPEECDIKEDYIEIIHDILNEKIDKDNYEYFEEKMMDLESGSIALCTLSAINWGKINKPEDFEKYCRLAVRSLDALLSYQDYPLPAAENNTMCYRPLGIGIIGFAHWMAKNDIKYTEPNLEIIDKFVEAWSYYLIKESVELAKEFGPCIKYYNTKYSKGILPIDTYKKEIDELVKHEERMDWDSLRKDLKKYGIRNATLMALMPSESSSQLANETNGIEPPRSYISIKQSKEGVLKQVVPEYKKLKNKYELLWDQKSPNGYLKICGVLQKYIDQTISVNTSYNPLFFKDEKIPLSVLLKDLMFSYYLGLKTLYYFNTYDGQGEIDVNKMLKKSKKDNKDGDIFVENSNSSYFEKSEEKSSLEKSSLLDQDDEKCDSCVL